MSEQKPVITGAEQNGQGFFTLNWSALKEADKYVITTSVPAVSGIYELYYQDEKKALNLLTVNQGWYGGLRSQIREAIDETFQTDPRILQILEDYKLFFRYSISERLADMQDVLWFLHKTYFGSKADVPHSNRYTRIYVKENAPDKIHWV